MRQERIKKGLKDDFDDQRLFYDCDGPRDTAWQSLVTRSVTPAPGLGERESRAPGAWARDNAVTTFCCHTLCVPHSPPPPPIRPWLMTPWQRSLTAVNTWPPSEPQASLRQKRKSVWPQDKRVRKSEAEVLRYWPECGSVQMWSDVTLTMTVTVTGGERDS